jgi:hypothetical protein
MRCSHASSNHLDRQGLSTWFGVTHRSPYIWGLCWLFIGLLVRLMPLVSNVGCNPMAWSSTRSTCGVGGYVPSPNTWGRVQTLHPQTCRSCRVGGYVPSPNTWGRVQTLHPRSGRWGRVQVPSPNTWGQVQRAIPKHMGSGATCHRQTLGVGCYVPSPKHAPAMLIKVSIYVHNSYRLGGHKLL